MSHSINLPSSSDNGFIQKNDLPWNKKAIIEEKLKIIFKHVPSTMLKMMISDIEKGNVTHTFSMMQSNTTNLEDVYENLLHLFCFDKKIEKIYAENMERFNTLDVAYNKIFELSSYIVENIDAWMDENLIILWNNHLRLLLPVDKQIKSNSPEKIRKLIDENKNHLNKIKYLNLMASKITIISREVNKLEGLEQVIADYSKLACRPRVFDAHKNKIKVYFN